MAVRSLASSSGNRNRIAVVFEPVPHLPSRIFLHLAVADRNARQRETTDPARVAALRASGVGWGRISRELKLGVSTVFRIARTQNEGSGACAAMLADVPMGESPIGGARSVTTVVISDRGKGDRPVGKLGGKTLRWLGETRSDPPGRQATRQAVAQANQRSRENPLPV